MGWPAALPAAAPSSLQRAHPDILPRVTGEPSAGHRSPKPRVAFSLGRNDSRPLDAVERVVASGSRGGAQELAYFGGASGHGRSRRVRELALAQARVDEAEDALGQRIGRRSSWRRRSGGERQKRRRAQEEQERQDPLAPQPVLWSELPGFPRRSPSGRRGGTGWRCSRGVLIAPPCMRQSMISATTMTAPAILARA